MTRFKKNEKRNNHPYHTFDLRRKLLILLVPAAVLILLILLFIRIMDHQEDDLHNNDTKSLYSQTEEIEPQAESDDVSVAMTITPTSDSTPTPVSTPGPVSASDTVSASAPVSSSAPISAPEPTDSITFAVPTEAIDSIESGRTAHIFQTWSGTEGLMEDELSTIARHDLVFGDTWLFGIGWNTSEEQPYSMLETELNMDFFDVAYSMREELKAENPDIIILCSLNYREAMLVADESGLEYWQKSELPHDSPYWIRRSDGSIAPGWGEDENGDGVVEESETVCGLVDFTNPDFQDLLIKRVEALKNSGLFDGIMLDWWSETYATSGTLDWSSTYLTAEDELNARITILKRIREAVGDDFLLLVNANKSEVPLSAPYVNGLFMECYKSNWNEGYSREDILQIETTLRWAEINLSSPVINCLEGWRVVTDLDGDLETRLLERQSEENLQWMRLFTSMSAVFSNGYVLFSDDNNMPSADHLHSWYDFWDIPLGEPLGEAFELETGCFIRHYTQADVVYNRSGHAVEYMGTTIDDLDGSILPKKAQ